MATLSKQGIEMDRINGLKFSLSLRSNGVILRNRGEGWKIVPLKTGVTTETYWSTIKEKELTISIEFADYRSAVQSDFPSLVNRLKYLELVSMLGDDTDAICCTLQDEGIDCDLDSLGEIESLRANWKAIRV